MKSKKSELLVMESDQIIWDENAKKAYELGAKDCVNELLPVIYTAVKQEIVGKLANEVKAALADGLRQGSSECGRVMVNLKYQNKLS